MNLKKVLIHLLIISSVVNLNVVAYAETSVKDEEKYILNNNTEDNRALAEEVFIDWIYDNSIIYVGADIEVEANVNEEAAVKDIEWKFTGDENIVNLDIQKNKVILTAINKGNIEVMAYAIDGSFASREIMLSIDDYPSDEISQLLIGTNITPIQRIFVNGINQLLQVEVNKSISKDDKVNAVDEYLKKLSVLGNLNDGYKKAESDNYEYYIINIDDLNNIELEIRVDKNDTSYMKIKDMIINASGYNNHLDNEENSQSENPNGEGNGDIDIPKEEELEEDNIEENTDLKIPEIEITQGVDGIIILGGEGLNEEEPVIVGIKEELTSKEKIQVMDKYLKTLKKNKKLKLIRKEDSKDYTGYILKVTEKIESLRRTEELKNDFFIEIRVNKDDKESYESIISMLDKIDNENDKKQESSKKDKDKSDKNNQDITKVDEDYTEESITKDNNIDIQLNDTENNIFDFAKQIINNIFGVNVKYEDNKIDNISENDIDKIKQEPEKIEEKLLATNINPGKGIINEEKNTYDIDKKSESKYNKVEIKSKKADEDYLELEKDDIESEDNNKYTDINMNLMTMMMVLPLTGIALIKIGCKKKD
ncbi:hypothetical protein [Clostridium butyricum]|uniref:hypothetical protein n=1 Tax=Clostridium butyricum TaxID=1492 RepID=UPI00041D91D2|nr:hypothetical protein [Clostridium butyricum]